MMKKMNLMSLPMSSQMMALASLLWAVVNLKMLTNAPNVYLMTLLFLALQTFIVNCIAHGSCKVLALIYSVLFVVGILSSLGNGGSGPLQGFMERIA
tara:strand:- start:291 stop:581 length:291 start_codon:yes stop_codon:yes gene_type:complete